MNYSVEASSNAGQNASVRIKHSEVSFGITAESDEELPNPAELFLASFSACILKNVERFSVLLKFDYSKAELTVNATRLENPPRLDEINYLLKVYSEDDRLNTDLLKKNIEKFGTIFNTVKASCSVNGRIEKVAE